MYQNFTVTERHYHFTFIPRIFTAPLFYDRPRAKMFEASGDGRCCAHDDAEIIPRELVSQIFFHAITWTNRFVRSVDFNAPRIENSPGEFREGISLPRYIARQYPRVKKEYASHPSNPTISS